MPVRSLNSAVLKWPDVDGVLSSARSWAAKLGSCRAEIRRILCFGSAAVGSWGVGSDLDLLIELTSSDLPFGSRELSYDPPVLPVPADILVYTTDELERMRREGRRFIKKLDSGSLVLYEARKQGAKPAE